MITTKKEWACDACGILAWVVSVMEETLPTPPHEWILVDVTRILPPRVVGEGDQKVKVGRSRETTRKAYCPTCKGRFL